MLLRTAKGTTLTSHSGPSRASSVFFSRAVEDTSVSIRSRHGVSSPWSRVSAGRRGPGRGCGLQAARLPFGPGAAWPGGRGSGTWGRLRRGNPRPFRLSLGPKEEISRSQGSNLGRTAALRAQRRLRSEKLGIKSK